MGTLSENFHREMRVMEFGCGLGGNLIAISAKIRSGVGVDLNPHYLRIARRLSSRNGKENLRFLSTRERAPMPIGEKFDLVYALGVFERLSREEVYRTLLDFHPNLVSGGKLCVYFLSNRARNSELTKRLGDGAYTFWSRDQIRDALANTGWEQSEVFPWGKGGRRTTEYDAPADVAIAIARGLDEGQ
jgi:cyclopropane fatty-acyl-phospholipid synthase-like methyltransferase